MPAPGSYTDHLALEDALTRHALATELAAIFNSHPARHSLHVRRCELASKAALCGYSQALHGDLIAWAGGRVSNFRMMRGATQ
jgi:hypothetical protein